MLFPLGRVVATPGVVELAAETGIDLASYLRRHAKGDWGDLDNEDKKTNDEALRYGNRLLSAYEVGNGDKIWIITEWDRSVTTLLKPEEY